jgi:hypothetical protein
MDPITEKKDRKRVQKKKASELSTKKCAKDQKRVTFICRLRKALRFLCIPYHRQVFGGEEHTSFVRTLKERWSRYKNNNAGPRYPQTPLWPNPYCKPIL